MNKPNFFIVGAAKCGTTALSEYLRQHPLIHMSWPKEPHYFAFDLENYRYPKNEDEYLNLFSEADKNTLIFGEASVFYLYSEVALIEIKKLYPDAKIVVLFRNPVDMLYSLHSQLLYSRDENVENFNKAWDLCESRKQGKKIPKHCREQKILYYDELAKFGAQYQSLIDVFDQDQIKVFLFDDFVKDSKKVYESIVDFLGLEKDNRVEFKKVNERRGHKIKWLSNLTQRPPTGFSFVIKFIKKTLGIKRIGVLDYLRRKNLTTKPREKISNNLKNKITEHYRSDISKLSKLIDRNLDHWMDEK